MVPELRISGRCIGTSRTVALQSRFGHLSTGSSMHVVDFDAYLKVFMSVVLCHYPWG